MEKFEAVKISDRIYWVGAIDWELRNFHGYKTPHGSTYNAYLILGTEPILVDTVKLPFFDEMMARIRSVINPKDITYLISNHSEMDHSGSLQKVLELISPKKVFASKMGHQALKAHFHFDVEITEVAQDEHMTLGDTHLRFIETRMLHWPDSMFTFVENDGVLFSQDGFGMHLASTNLFSDEHGHESLKEEASSYFANILMPYASLIPKLLSSKAFSELKLELVAPDHGPIWRGSDEIKWITDLYMQWAEQQYYKKVIIVYDTMWQSTDKMARSIADGVRSEGIAVKLLSMGESYRSEVATEILDAGALLVGTPTMNQQMFPTIADTLCYIKGLKPKKLLAQAFGSYGWSAEGVAQVQGVLKEMGATMLGEPLKINYVPRDEDLVICREFGIMVAKKLLEFSAK